MSALNNSCDLIDLDDEVFTANIDSNNFRSSFDNNPFDKAQRLAANFNDPFEIVEKNINLSRISSNNGSNVRTENLISICDNGGDADEKNTQKETDGKFIVSTNTTNYLSVTRDIRYRSADSTTSISPIQSPTLSDNAVTDLNSNTFNKGFCADSTGLSSDMSSMNSQLNKGFILDSLASLQISSNNKSPNDIKGSNLERLSTTDCNISSVEKRLNSRRGHNKLRTGSLDMNSPRGLNCMRNQLLKLSLSNSSLNSPAKRTDNKDSKDKSANSSIYSEARTLAESILNVDENDSSQNDSCDDLMSIKPNWVDSENELDNDLEQLNIPFLQEMAKTECKNNQDLNRTGISEQLLKDIKHHKDTYQVENKQPSTEIYKSMEKTDQDNDKVEKLIDNLKHCLESYDEEKKDRANSLLETLSFVLNKNEVMSSVPSGLSVVAPTPIVRQGTFDLDIHDTAEIIKNTPSIGTYNKTDIKIRGDNVYEANVGSSNNLGTNVVVMNTPIPMAKEKSNKEVNFREPVFIEMRTKRSQSVSLHDKPNLSAAKYRQSTYSESPSVYGTPIRPRITSRRYSVSGTPPPLPSINARRSIYGIQNNDISKTNVSQRRSLAPAPIKITAGHKNNPTIKLDTIGKTLKVKNNDHLKKLKGPLKATIPIKKVAPMIVTPSISSPIDGDLKKPKTSTPILNVKGRPSACSTPVQNNRVSPIQNATIKPKPRQSYLSVTPNGKLQSTSSSFHNRRRTKSASKSPKKSLDATNDKGSLEIRTLKLPQESPKMSTSLRKCSSINSTVNRKVNTGFSNEKNKENNIPK